MVSGHAPSHGGINDKRPCQQLFSARAAGGSRPAAVAGMTDQRSKGIKDRKDEDEDSCILKSGQSFPTPTCWQQLSLGVALFHDC
jgi:hypothetical protein